MQDAQVTPPPPLTASVAAPVDGQAVLAKVARRIIPFLFLLYVVNYIDRANISFTKAPMKADLLLSDGQYGLAAGVFFIGYALLEVPSNLAMQRVGARRWLAGILASWGIVAACMALVRGPTSFSLLRAVLGAAEAGFMPGIILYLMGWFPKRRRAQAIGLFLTATALSGMIGSPLSVQVLKMNHLLGLHGWQWVFLLEGLACLPLALLTLFWLPDKPTDAAWLMPEQAQWLEAELRADAGDAHHHAHQLLAAFTDWRVWLLAVDYFLLIAGLFGFIFWAPDTIVDKTGGWLTSAPFLVGAVAMTLIGRHSDRTGERRWHVLACGLVGAAGMAATALCPGKPVALATLSLGAIGIWGCLGPFWAMPTGFLRGDAAAGGIAIINSIGCTAGLFTPWAIGAIKDRTHGFEGLYLVAGALCAGGILALLVRKVDSN